MTVAIIGVVLITALFSGDNTYTVNNYCKKNFVIRQRLIK